MARRPTRSPSDALASEIKESYYHDCFSPYNSAEEFLPFVELGRNSGESRHRDHWVDPPVSYVPSSWPTGPRNLPPDHYVCPYKGCKHPVGPNDSDEGYNRETLGLHIQSHSGEGSSFGSLRRTVQMRFEAARDALHPNPDEISQDDDELARYGSLKGSQLETDEMSQDDDEFDDYGSPKGSQRETDDLIQELEKLKYWECYTHSAEGSRNMAMLRSSDRKRRAELRRERKERALWDAAEDADDESAPHQNSNRFRNNRFRRQKNLFYDNIEQYLEESGSASYDNFIATMQSTQEKAMDSDSSFGPPRKKARKSQSQLDVSYDDLFPQTG